MMARVVFLLGLLLATFYGASGIALICDWDSLKYCTDQVEGLEEDTDREKLCEPLKAGYDCLQRIKKWCSAELEENSKVMESVKTTLDEMDEGVEYCSEYWSEHNMNNDGAFGVATFSNNMGNHPMPAVASENVNQHTTHQDPYKGNDYHTTRDPMTEPHIEHCNWQMIQNCTEGLRQIYAGMDNMLMCNTYRHTKECYNKMLTNCHDYDIKQTIAQSMDEVDNVLAACPQDNHYGTWTTRDPWAEQHPDNHYETTRDPWAEPHPSNDGSSGNGALHHNPEECSSGNFDMCSSRIHTMKDDTNNDAHEMCKIWWETKACYAKFYDNCGSPGDVRTDVDSTWGYMQGVMDYCKHYTTCTEEKREKCMEKITKWMSSEDKCRESHHAQDCLHEIGDGCLDPFERYMIYEEALADVEKWLRNCSLHTTKDPWANHDNHYETTRDPWAEPHPDNNDQYGTTRDPWAEPHPDNGNHYGTTRDPWAEPHNEPCNWDMIQKCSGNLHNIAGVDTYQRCSLYSQAKTCFNNLMNNCHDHSIMENIRQSVGGLDQALMTCPQDSGNHDGGSGDHHPHPTHHSPTECSHQNFDMCTKPLHSMKEDSNNDPHQMCRIWWDAKSCYSKFFHNCGMNDIKKSVESTWGYMKGQMDYCKHYTTCSEEKRHQCTEGFHNAWSMEDKCRESGHAKDCLHDIGGDCEDSFERHMIYEDALPPVEQKLRDCMYGTGAGAGSLSGDGHGPDHSWASSAPVTAGHVILQPLILALLVTSLAYLMRV